MNSSEGAVRRGHVVTDGGEREEEDEGGGVSGPGTEAGSSMLVPTAWPLPVLGTPNPVIIQNTQGLTGFLSQHHFPVSSSGPCAAILPSLQSALFPSKAENRWPLITLTWPVRIYILVLRPKEKNCLPRQLDTEQHAAWKKNKIKK